MDNSPSINHLSLIELTTDCIDDIMPIEQAAYEVPWSKGHFLDCLKSDYLMQIIMDEGEIIGYWVLQIILDELHILNICVNPAHQGNGFGKKMLESLKEYCSTKGMNRILLEVRRNNKVARNLYKTSGFKQIGLRKGYYPGVGHTRVDAIVMEFLFD